MEHHFVDDRCITCDCRPWGHAALFECGYTGPVPEMTVAEFTIRAALYAQFKKEIGEG